MVNPFSERCEKCGHVKVIAIIGNSWGYVCPNCDVENGYYITNRVDNETVVLDKMGECCLSSSPQKKCEDAEIVIESEDRR